MINNPTFSFIVPVYNTSEYLHKCLDSIVNQSYPNIEVILVNDGSTDSSDSICDDYAEKDTRIRVIHKTNEGLSAARNDGISRATGDYIIFVDSDDFIETETCKELKNLIHTHRDVDIIASSCKAIYPNHIQHYKYYTPKSSMSMSGNEFLKLQLKKKKMRLSSCLNIYRRAFLTENQFSFAVGIIHEDDLWTPSVYLRAERVVISDFVHYNYFIREGSLTRSNNHLRQAECKLFVANELEKLYDTITDTELKSMLMNTLVNKFFFAFRLIKPLEQWDSKKHLFQKSFLKNKASSMNNKWRVLLFTTFGADAYYSMRSSTRKYEIKIKQLFRKIKFRFSQMKKS
jgi:glycosyltransferase involved in cell wall biosynthesis